MKTKRLCKTRPPHASGAKKSPACKAVVCQKCGRKFDPTRKWQVYCSAKCRKLSWLRGAAKTAILDDHEARLRAIEKKLGMKGELP